MSNRDFMKNQEIGRELYIEKIPINFKNTNVQIIYSGIPVLQVVGKEIEGFQVSQTIGTMGGPAYIIELMLDKDINTDLLSIQESLEIDNDACLITEEQENEDILYVQSGKQGKHKVLTWDKANKVITIWNFRKAYFDDNSNLLIEAGNNSLCEELL